MCLWSNNMSISSTEFGYVASAAPGTSLYLPSKFIVGFHTEKLRNNNIIFSGISNENTALVARINIGSTATAFNRNANLILVYDTLIECDLENGQISVKK